MHERRAILVRLTLETWNLEIAFFASSSPAPGKIIVQGSDRDKEGCSLSDKELTYSPVLNAIRTVWTASGIKVETVGVDEMAAADSKPVQRPTI